MSSISMDNDILTYRPIVMCIGSINEKKLNHGSTKNTGQDHMNKINTVSSMLSFRESDTNKVIIIIIITLSLIHI